MALTAAQYTALQADILADPALSAIPNTPDGNFDIAAEYNKLSSVSGNPPAAFTVWRTDVAVEDVKNAIVWTEYIAATSDAERDAQNLIISNGTVNAADPNIRQAFLDIYSGPQKATTRSNLTEISKREARRVEALFATGTGTTASPGTMVVEGTISFQDVTIARSL